MVTCRVFVCAAAAAIGLAALLGFADDAEAQKRVRWKMQSAFGGQLPHLCTSGVRFSMVKSESMLV